MEPRTTNVTVGYADSEPTSIKLNTRRFESESSYAQEYRFKMDGSTAVLVSIEGDSDAYNVRANSETRRIAAEQSKICRLCKLW